MTARPSGPAGGLGRPAIVGMVTRILSRSARALVGLGTVVLLSRYLAPSEFGLFAFVFFFVTFAQILGDSGMRSALVVRQDASDLEEDSVFWLSIGIGMVLTTLTLIFAADIARLFNEPALVWPLQAVAIVFVLNSVRSVPQAQLERSFKFQSLAISEVAASVSGAAVAIGLALAGEGVMALVGQQLTMALVPSVLNLRAAGYRPQLRFSFAAVRPLLGFGGSVTLAGMLQFLAGNIDRPIVGARLSATDLGMLSVAQQVVLTPLRIVVNNVRQISFPIMASIQNENQRILAAHASSLHAVMLAMGPLCFGLSAVSEPAVRVLLGPQWTRAGDVIGIAAITALITAMGGLNNAIFASKGRGTYMLNMAIFALAANSLLLWFTVPYGLIVIVLGRLLYVSVALLVDTHFLSRQLGCRRRDLVLCFVRPLLASMMMAAAVAAIDRLWLAGQASAVLRLLLLVPAGALLYAGALWLVDRDKVRILFGRLKAARGKPAV